MDKEWNLKNKRMNLYNQIKYNGYHINIYYDDDAGSPRKMFDNLGTLRRYRPEKEFDEHFDIDKVFDGRIGNFRGSFLKEYIALPVYLYEHSGTTVSTSPFSCPWDSGFFGIIAVPLDKVRREYGWKNITVERRKRIEEYLQGEIKTLDDYYTGEVFGYCITPEDDDSNELDSCWGFYGTDSLKEMEAECRHIIDGLDKAA